MSDCITLPNKPRKDGYVRTTFGGKQEYAHRHFYVKEHGSIPKEMEIDHICENRSCVNVNHLAAVPHIQNMSHAKSRWLHTGFCKKNHDLNIVGIYIRRNGDKTCKECKRENLRKWRNEIKQLNKENNNE